MSRGLSQIGSKYPVTQSDEYIISRQVKYQQVRNSIRGVVETKITSSEIVFFVICGKMVPGKVGTTLAHLILSPQVPTLKHPQILVGKKMNEREYTNT